MFTIHLFIILLSTGIVLISEMKNGNISVKFHIVQMTIQAVMLNLILIALMHILGSNIVIYFVLEYGIFVLYLFIIGTFSFYDSFLIANTATLFLLPFCFSNENILLKNISGWNIFLHLLLQLLVFCSAIASIILLIIYFSNSNMHKKSTLKISVGFLLVFLTLMFIDFIVWPPESKMIIISFISLVILENIFFVIFFLACKRNKKIILQKLAETTQHYELILATHQMEAKELHDRNHHIQILKSFLQNGNVEKALDYLNEFQSSFEIKTNDPHIISDKNSPFILSGNDIVDYILAEERIKSGEKNITMEIEVSVLPSILPIRSGHLCCLLSNAIDNAIESAHKSIQIIITTRGEMLLIKIENDCKNAPEFQNGKLLSSKEDTINHGYGIQIMEEIVKYYEGYISYDFKHDQFLLQILLNL